MFSRFFLRVLSMSLLLTISATLMADHRVLMQGKGKLAIVGEDGSIEWEMPWGGIHDLHVLDNGHFMVQRNMREVVEIDPESKEVVWSYDASKQNGNEGKKIEVHAFQPLPNGDVMIAESGSGRIIEINRDGEIQKEFKLKVDNPHPHTDTRLARKLDNGNYLVCHEADGTVREYDESGHVVWEYNIPMFGKATQGGHGLGAFGNKCFGALRLENGNTLIATGNGHAVLEVTKDKHIVWQIHQNDLPGIQLAWVTTLEVLPNGNYVIGNCHAGPRNPLLIEIDPKTREVVWEFDQYDIFGNSAPNSRILPEKVAEPENTVLSIGDAAPPIAIAKWVKGDAAEEFADNQVYVVEFWATWCGPCLAGMPHISELQQKYGDRVKFIGVTDEDLDTVTTFLEREARGVEGTWDEVIKYTLAVDDDGTTNNNYMRAAEQNGIPCAFIVGKDQHIEWIGHPMSIDDALEAVVTDSWDRAAEREKFEQEQKAERAFNAARRELQAAFQEEDWDAALKVIDGLEEQGVSGMQTGMLRARILFQAGRPEERLTHLGEMVDSFWEDPQALNEISWMIASGPGKKDDDELKLALRGADQGVKLTDSKDGSVLDTLARVHYEMGELDQAIEIQRKAVELQPIRQIRAALELYERKKKEAEADETDEAGEADETDEESE